MDDVDNGTLSLESDGSFVYIPDANFSGIDTFRYRLLTYPAIQNLWADEADVTITINSVADAPVLKPIDDDTIPNW